MNYTYWGDFVRIKDSEKYVEKKLEEIREHLKKPYKGVIRFNEKTAEQLSKERYDKVLEEVNFDYQKLHDWIYDEENKDKVEIIKKNMMSEVEYQESIKSIFDYIESRVNKWRIRWGAWNNKKDRREIKYLVNEETGQVIYSNLSIREKILLDLYWEKKYNSGITTHLLIDIPKEKSKNWVAGRHICDSVVIFLHGTYGAINDFHEVEKLFPNTKFIYPYSPTLQYDMWHGTKPAPGEQCRGWINITGDVHEIMDVDVCPNNSPPKKTFEEADQIIHLDYPQLMRSVSYVNEIIEEEIEAGISPEKIFIAGYSQGGLLTLATALTSQHKLGGFVSLCGLLPRWDKLLVNPSAKNKETPIMIINNSGDHRVPFWTGKKSYDLLKERGYNLEFKNHPGLGHNWRNEEVIEFLEKCLNERTKKNQEINQWSPVQKIIILDGIFVIIIVVCLMTFRKKNKNYQSKSGVVSSR